RRNRRIELLRQTHHVAVGLQVENVLAELRLELRERLLDQLLEFRPRIAAVAGSLDESIERLGAEQSALEGEVEGQRPGREVMAIGDLSIADVREHELLRPAA